jgi:hypothetical protein
MRHSRQGDVGGRMMERVERKYHWRVVRSQNDFLRAMAVRAACFDDCERLPCDRLFDGNDLCATHIIVFADEEPVGTVRIRWFNGFAKLERTGVRPQFRDSPALRIRAEYTHRHIAMKDYPIAITHAEQKYATLWRRSLDYRINPDKPAFRVAGHDADYVELVKQLPKLNSAIDANSDVMALGRIAGERESPSPLE